ncbi:glycerate kinase [Pseudactinotalea sp. Z1732]|uniref:glycerate kinase n=1 Tax=Micrococcales TaxID=85006 RepID=UPI003C79F7CC
MRVLIAPDHFGGTLTAAQAGQVLARPWDGGGHEVLTAAMSDGSTGLIDAVQAARGGTLTPIEVRGSLGSPVPAAVLHVGGDGGGTAYIDGAALLGFSADGSSPEDARARAVEGSSAGLADLLQAAVAGGATRVVIGLGPSPTHDGGAGLLRRLTELTGLGTGTDAPAWSALAGLREHLAGVDLVVAAATDTPLVGLHGAGAGLQRFGINALEAQQIESATSVFAHDAAGHARALTPLRPVLAGHAHVLEPSSSHTGAGGGAAFALGLLGARVLPGAAVVGEEVGLRDLMSRADLVLTGTASLDADAMHEGVVATVGSLAAERGLPVVAVAHEVYVNRREMATVGISAAYPLIDQPLVPGNRPAAAHPADPVQALGARSVRVMRNWATA